MTLTYTIQALTLVDSYRIHNVRLVSQQHGESGQVIIDGTLVYRVIQAIFVTLLYEHKLQSFDHVIRTCVTMERAIFLNIPFLQNTTVYLIEYYSFTKY